MNNNKHINISSEKDFDDLIHRSKNTSDTFYAIFKHSTRCPISSMALKRMDKSDFFDKHHIPYYYLDLLAYRNVSNYIAQQLKVEHQSPQIIILKNGSVVCHTSHNDINEDWLNENIH
ncbi:MAG: bacillithiol system redox-active protein YtxJ [Bacteroidia bacterium]|nr:bacillithiol system redox-active protein YtxJ [Bacteroidia bacterium]MCZ2249838.1 bacillithiol system redox-active protein YtxJ [Bacteroidia bacterium]